MERPGLYLKRALAISFSFLSSFLGGDGECHALGGCKSNTYHNLEKSFVGLPWVLGCWGAMGVASDGKEKELSLRFAKVGWRRGVGVSFCRSYIILSSVFFFAG